MMARVMLLLSAAALTAGCAAGPGTGPSSRESAQTQAPDGITINCSGANSGWVFCYRSASEVCGSPGYTVIKRDPVAVASTTGSRSMLVKCN